MSARIVRALDVFETWSWIIDPDTGEMLTMAPGEEWQGPRRKGDPVCLGVDYERGVVTYGAPEE